MRKDQILAESKKYLISIHDTLRRTFRFSDSPEKEFVFKILDGIENDVKQLETLSEFLKGKDVKEKNKTMEIEE